MKRKIVYFVVALFVMGSVRADQTVQSMQQAPKDQGFYYGNVTGEKNAETTAAVRRYQIRSGLKVTGEMDPQTLQSLNVNSNSVERHAKVAASKMLIATMKQAWADTHGGKISPARPW